MHIMIYFPIFFSEEHYRVSSHDVQHHIARM